MRIYRLLFLFCSFFVCHSSFSQDSCQLQISLLTCSPGEELYSTFGHTAIRVKEPSTGTDIVFNYGTFDDRDPNFYYKFTQGIMVYALSVYPFSDFDMEYREQHRGVIEQVIDLPCAAKHSLFKALQVNGAEANRFYNYYFHEDNCTTRAKVMTEKSAGSAVTFKDILRGKRTTFRQLIYIYLDSGQQHWSKFGIDMFLGSNMDKPVTNEQAMFLPDMLMKGFDSALVNGHPLVSSKQTIIPAIAGKPASMIFTPALVFWLLLALVVAASFIRASWARTFLKFFDVSLLLLLGLFGLLMLVLWIIRVDTVCRDNFNLLWALPTHLPIAFLYFKNKKWITGYFRFTVVISLLLAALWAFLPQHLNTAVIPLLIIIILRSYFRARKS
jgi:Domain of unknown function (DUF4105)